MEAILGIILLFVGADQLVKGSAGLAYKFGISSLIVGLTIVAYGTSAPEAVTGIQAAIQDAHGVAVGNIIGSNIFNILAILGPVALIIPTRIAKAVIKKDLPLLVFVCLIFWYFIHDGKLSQFEGFILCAGAITYTVQSIFFSKRIETEEQHANTKIYILFAQIILGLGMLIIGSKFFVSGAITIAHYFEVSEEVIGLTIVAIGTSLPELITSLVAAVKKEQDIAVGNIIGSNLFNLLGVGGITALCSPEGIAVTKGVVNVDIFVMIGATLICIPIFLTGKVITRFEGVIMTTAYALYMFWLL